jgi:hypothetical protein
MKKRVSRLTKKKGIQLAVKAYSEANGPVVVVTSDDHYAYSREDLQSIVDLGLTVTGGIVKIDATLAEWNASDWPEIFEATRQLWLNGKGPFSGRQT